MVFGGMVIAQKTTDRSIKVSERGAHQLKPLSLVFEQATFSPPVSGSPKQVKKRALISFAKQRFLFPCKTLLPPSTGVASTLSPWDAVVGVAQA